MYKPIHDNAMLMLRWPMVRAIGKACVVLGMAAWAVAAQAQGRLLGTGGAIPIDGAAGGGIVPWAVLSGYSTRDEHGPTAAFTTVHSTDYRLDSLAFSYNWRNRVEFSLGRQELDIGALSGALGFDPGVLRQEVAGVKVRLTGDAVYSRRPQIAFGLLHKKSTEFTVPAAAGAQSDTDTEPYLAFTKVFLAGLFKRTTLVNLTMRATRANQTGLLGFGGDRRNDSVLMAEFSTAVFVTRKLAVGYEFREKPNNLNFADEDDWQDAFVAFFPTKRFSVVGAYADLGPIAGIENQKGLYLSVQGMF